MYSWPQNRHLNSRPSSSEPNPREAERQRDCLILYLLNYRLHCPPALGPEVLSDELSEPPSGSLKGHLLSCTVRPAAEPGWACSGHICWAATMQRAGAAVWAPAAQSICPSSSCAERVLFSFLLAESYGILWIWMLAILKRKKKKKAFPVQRPNRSPIDSANVKNIWQKNTTLFQIKTTWVPKGVTITLKNLGQFQSHHQLFGWNVCYVSGMVASNLNQNRGPKSSELWKNSGLLPGVSWARLSSGPRRSLLPD